MRKLVQKALNFKIFFKKHQNIKAWNFFLHEEKETK